MPLHVELYGTEYCHLCETAETLLHEAGIAYTAVDIAEDDKLLDRYGVRIPVLRRTDTGTELGWPFDAAALSGFLA